MRFYLILLSIYSIAITILALLLMAQNRKLKQADAPPPVDYSTVYELDLQDVPMRGPETAPVTIVAYTDFECPFCVKGNETLQKIYAEYPEQLRLGFKNLPLPFHANARPAAAAALAAYRQGKFWDMADQLFANQARLGADLYREIGEKISLDMDKFTSDMNPKNWEEYLQIQQQEAEHVGVTGTPTFFVNGVKIGGASYNLLREAVERALSKK